MSVFQFLGSFVQSTFFGGTYDDLAFEVRVLKGEVQRLHDRLDRELATVRDRLDKLEGKPGAGKGRSRLSVMSAAAAADAGGPAHAAPDKQQAAPAEDAGGSSPAPTRVAHTAEGLETQGSGPVDPRWRLLDAWRFHPKAPDVFARHSLPACPDCALSEVESVAEGVGNHGIDPVRFVAELNRLAEN